jgi:hypothetical protein
VQTDEAFVWRAGKNEQRAYENMKRPIITLRILCSFLHHTGYVAARPLALLKEHESLYLDQWWQLAGESDPVVLDNHDALNAFNGSNALQSRIHVLDGRNQVCGLRSGCVRERGISGHNRGKVAPAHTIRVTHSSG